MKLKFIFLPLVLAHGAALAHEGHGFQTLSHWHASDALGLLALAAVVAVLWSFIKRK
jgi:hypothetical protein